MAHRLLHTRDASLLRRHLVVLRQVVLVRMLGHHHLWLRLSRVMMVRRHPLLGHHLRMLDVGIVMMRVRVHLRRHRLPVLWMLRPHLMRRHR